VQPPRRKKIDVLREQLGASDGSLAGLKKIASSLKLMEDRYMARPAAELMVDHGDPAAPRISAALAATPVLGRDPMGDILREAFKRALAREGIPPDVEQMARDFYERRGEKGAHRSSPPPAPRATDEDWIGKSETGGFFDSIRKLFGGRS
jgi:hypothetical protein